MRFNFRRAGGPQLASITPTSATQYGAAATLTCTGVFENGDTIYVDGVAQATTFVNATTLTTPLPSGGTAGTLLTVAGAKSVTVRRGSRESAPQTLTVTAWSPALLPAGWSWHRGDVGKTVPVGVSQWDDQLPGVGGSYSFTNGSGTAQPSVLENSALWGNQTALGFDGSNDSLANASTSATNFLHDGTGCTVAVAFRQAAATGNGTVLDSCTSTSANTGFNLVHDATNQRLSLFVGKGSSGNPVISFSSANNSAPNAERHYVVVRHKTTNTPQFSVRRNGVQLGSGPYTNPPSAGNATNELRLGARSATIGIPLNGSIAELIMCNDYGADADVQQIERYFSARYGA